MSASSTAMPKQDRLDQRAPEYMSAGETLRRLMRAQPEPPIDKRDLVADRLPQGARLDSQLFLEGSTHRAANGRVLQDLRTRRGVHRPTPSGPPRAVKRGRPPAAGPSVSRAQKPQLSLSGRQYHWRKLARPIKVSTEDWELLRLATVELLTAPQIAVKLGGSVTAAVVRKRLQRVRAAVKAANA